MQFIEADTFGQLLKLLRKKSDLSQAALAERLQTTTRYISNLETGQTKPTRSMVKRLSAALAANNQISSELHRVAGFANESYQLEDEAYKQAVDQSVALALEHHMPFPAIAINRRYDVISANEALHKGFQFLWGEGYERFKTPVSIFELLFDVSGLGGYFHDFQAYAHFLIQRLLREQLSNPDAAQLIKEMQQKLPDLPAQWWELDPEYKPLPNYITSLNIRGVDYEAMGVVHSIGSPHDVGGNETRVIFVYPVNQAAEELFNSW